MEVFNLAIEEAWKLERTVKDSHVLEGESTPAEQLATVEDRVSSNQDQSSMEISSCLASKWIYNQRDTCAAHVLVQMANEDSCLLSNGLNSDRLKHGMEGVLRQKWDTKGDDHSEVSTSGKTGKVFVKRQQAVSRSWVRDDGGDAVLALPAMPCPARRRKDKTMNIKMKKSSLRTIYTNSNASEDKNGNLYEASYRVLDGHELTHRLRNNDQQSTKICLDDRYDRLGLLNIRKRKRSARPYLKREEAVDLAVPVQLPRHLNSNANKEEDEILHEVCQLLDGHELTNRLGNNDQQSTKNRLDDRYDRLGLLNIKKRKRSARPYLKRKETVDLAVPVHLPRHLNSNVNKEEDDNLQEVCQLLDGHKMSGRWGFNDQKLFEAALEDLNTRLGMLSLKKQKSVARSYMKRQTEDSAVPIKNPLKMLNNVAVPTVHTNVSFSVIHLLTSIRGAMVGQRGFNSLNSIVEQVISNPIDSRILQSREPLQDLVRGVLKIFSSEKAPLGTEGWKPLTLYHKATESWLWIGPIKCWDASHLLSITAPENEEDVSSEAWSLPHQMLVDLVDCFSIWFKKVQERLCSVGSHPAPSLVLMKPTLNRRERFRGLKGRRRSISTINPSSEEVRAYFHKEEALRYSSPDSAFRYTALDDGKSAVAPVRKGKMSRNQKLTIKPDWSPHISTMSLVRDAAARLPGGRGTITDICTLLRDSQYVVEDVCDEQLKQFVGSRLTRLQYEVDPCVNCNGKLWIYLHRNRGLEDFEANGSCYAYQKKKKTMRKKCRKKLAHHSE